MTTKTETLRTIVTELDDAGYSPHAIAAELNIPTAHVERILDTLDPPHDPWIMNRAPTLEPQPGRHQLQANEPTEQPRHTDLPNRAPNEPKAPRTLQPCGTLAAYRRHRARKEPVDRACLDVRNADTRERAAKKASQ